MKTGREDFARTAKRPEAMPVFETLAQDVLWRDMVDHWCAKALEAGVPVAVVEQVLQLGDEGDRWPIKKLADADHLTVEQRLDLELAFATRQWGPRPTAEADLRTREYVKGFADGGAARERTLHAVIARLQQQLGEARAELAGRAPPAPAEEPDGDEQAALDFLAGVQTPETGGTSLQSEGPL